MSPFYVAAVAHRGLRWPQLMYWSVHKGYSQPDSMYRSCCKIYVPNGENTLYSGIKMTYGWTRNDDVSRPSHQRAGPRSLEFGHGSIADNKNHRSRSRADRHTAPGCCGQGGAQADRSSRHPARRCLLRPLPRVIPAPASPSPYRPSKGRNPWQLPPQPPTNSLTRRSVNQRNPRSPHWSAAPSSIMTSSSTPVPRPWCSTGSSSTRATRPWPRCCPWPPSGSPTWPAPSGPSCWVAGAI